MIKVISNFIESLGPDIKSLGLKSKAGLHILLEVQYEQELISISKTSFKYVYTQKKDTDSDDIHLLKKTSSLSRLAWCINTNKCFDLPIKAIHSCSPYCIAIKRENLLGGEKYANNTKSQVYDRLDNYFDKAVQLIKSDEDEKLALAFRSSLNGIEKYSYWLTKIPIYKDIKDTDYVIFYLDVPVEKYAKANAEYLAENLFNTNKYNQRVDDQIYGTSDFLNGYPTKKPFLIHQSASFDIANRISSKEAKDLYEFQDIMSRNILPKPLPLFIHNDELIEMNGESLKGASIKIIKREAENGNKIGYREIIEELYEKYQENFGNFYLLFFDGFEVKDFDFVSKFDYQLIDVNGENWRITDYFEGGNEQTIRNVFQFQQSVLQPVFNNNLITKTKTGIYQYKYFDDIESKYCKSNVTYLHIMKYRKAFYDFIYKSKRQAITSTIFDEILQGEILADLRMDEIKNGFHSQERNIRQKLNIWFSITNNFINSKNNQTMGNKLLANRQFIDMLAKEKANITTDEEYAFTVGQVIYYLLSKSKTADRSYKRLEPFMQQVHSRELNKALSRLFDSYKHENFSSNFKNPFSQVLGYETSTNVRELIPTILSGIFSPNVLFSSKDSEDERMVIVPEENVD